MTPEEIVNNLTNEQKELVALNRELGETIGTLQGMLYGKDIRMAMTHAQIEKVEAMIARIDARKSHLL